MSTTVPPRSPTTRDPEPPAEIRLGGSAPTGPRERLLSLDVFRGLTIAGMLLVNDPGTWSAVYPPLEHAAWNGWTPTDLIFPFFLFIVGVTTHLSLTARRARGHSEADIRRQIIRRGLVIFLLGFVVSGVPFFTWTPIHGMAHPSFLDRIVDRLLNWRIMGVLQRIGLAYIAAALLTQGKTVKRQVITVCVLLIGYWFVMTMLPVPDSGAMGQLVLNDPAHTMSAWWDRLLLDWRRFGLGNHLWPSSESWDPEGLFSTIPAVGTTILGNLAGQWLDSRNAVGERINGLFAGGCIGMMLGLMWNWSFPINKSLWTSSYVLFTAGLAAVSIATIMWAVDVHQVKWWTKPFVIFGMNPITAFVGSFFMERMIYTVLSVSYNGQRVPLETGIYNWVFAPWLAPVNASLAFAIAFVLLWFAILSWMFHRRIFLKV